MSSQPSIVTPPLAPRQQHLSDWHGEQVDDPWHWLREKSNPEVLAYLAAENAYTESMTAEQEPFAAALYAEMLGRLKQTDLSVPVRRGEHFYFSRTEEGKQYPRHVRSRATADGSLDAMAPEELLLDLNELAAGHSYLGLGAFAVSNDGNRLVYSTDTSGFRQYTLYTKDLRTGQTSPQLAERVTSVAWAADHRTVFYAEEDAVTKRANKLFRIDLDAPAPVLLFEETDELYRLGVACTKDRAYIVVESSSTDTWEARVLEASRPEGEFKVLLVREKGHKYEVEHRAGRFYFRTNRGAKNFRLVTAPVRDPSPSAWTELVPARDDVLLTGVEPFSDYLVLHERTLALDGFRVLNFATEKWHEVRFDEPVYTVSGAGTPEFHSQTFRFLYQSPATPPSVYDCALATGALTLLKQTEVLGGYDRARYVTERRWATARDGKRVPLSLFYLRGTALDGTAPALLYAYGSYGYGMPAAFSSARLSLVNRGVVYAIAHIRGGNELGEAWHEDGMLLKKKNTFFDFIDSAQWLCDNKYTSPARLAIEGGSAGGLLMGAVVNLRPELFRAVHAAVPFVDVLNTMFDASLPLTVGEYLEWGDPNDKRAFEYMRSYSPYDNLAARDYPAMLVTTSLNDSQVMYWEPAKYVAKMRALRTDARPLLLKCNMGAGHGGASGRYDRLAELAFEYAWLLSQLGISA